MKDWNALEPDKYALVGGHRFTRGRTRPIDRIVIHHNAGVNLTTEDCRDLWNNSREASAHYQVERDGTIGQLVNDGDTAWHAANADINARSIGIEHANIGGPPRWQISDETIENGARLVAALCRGYNLGRPTWGRNVFPHSAYASTSCPHQLAPGGEDHATYMARAQWWFDNWNTPNPSPKEPDMSPEDRALLIETRDLCRFIRDQLAGPGGSGGWPQGGKRTLYDLASAIAEIEGVPNTRDTL
ncbi:peptidoglycan recognition protein family protein [Corynebacterium senegalense]|uniref:peptidoglycan recognition protein family protein n=1 Tax=Corynebacterium senegalense TaxID=2080750 RepID=UPI000E1FD996|nr:peptidoglycan recognition family protein [Corynebacterium senegalense]